MADYIFSQIVRCGLCDLCVRCGKIDFLQPGAIGTARPAVTPYLGKRLGVKPLRLRKVHNSEFTGQAEGVRL